MSNDDNKLGAAMLLAAGGAAGFAAGRWLVEPWLQSRGSSVAQPTTPARAAAASPLRARGAAAASSTASDQYAGPSGRMQPIDPYADSVPVSEQLSTSTATAPSTSRPISAPTTTTPGPIMSPSEVDPSLSAPVRTAGPVTAPSQLAVSSRSSQAERPSIGPSQLIIPQRPSTASPRFATSAGVRRFDSIYERFRGNLPIEYVRALVERESDGRPDVRTRSAIGLMQIVPVVLTDYNKRHGTAIQSEQLVDPATNVTIACELLRLIVGSYRKNHPYVPNLQTDWNNLRFVELLTLGWNAGFSEAGGLGRVARYLEGLGIVDITIDLVTAHAQPAGATKHLSNPAKVAWCKSVATLYQRERALVRTRPVAA